jgi:uncharacterized protein (DUF2062 family)
MQRQYLKFVRRFYRQLRSPQLRSNRFFAGLVHRLSNRRLWKPCRTTVSHGLAIGLFFSMMLPMPFQSVVAAFFAIRSRVNVPFAMMIVWISNPVTTLPLALMQVRLGQFLRDVLNIPVPSFLDVTGLFPCTTIECNAANFVLGMLFSGVIASILAYPIVHVVSLFLPHHLPEKREESPREKRQRSAHAALKTKNIEG